MASLSDDAFDDVPWWDIELSEYFAVNVVGIAPLNNGISLYVKAGLTKLEFEDNDDDTYDGTGLSYGVGAKFAFSDAVAMKFEYTRLPDTDNSEWDLDIEADTLNLGVQFLF